MRVTIEAAGGETSDVSCRLLVAADGGDSKARKRQMLTGSIQGVEGWGFSKEVARASHRCFCVQWEGRWRKGDRGVLI